MRRYSQRLSLAGEKNQLYIESMTKQEKLMGSLRNNPRAVRFDDACKIAERPGFSRQGESSKQSSNNVTLFEHFQHLSITARQR